MMPVLPRLLGVEDILAITGVTAPVMARWRHYPAETGFPMPYGRHADLGVVWLEDLVLDWLDQLGFVPGQPWSPPARLTLRSY